MPFWNHLIRPFRLNNLQVSSKVFNKFRRSRQFRLTPTRALQKQCYDTNIRCYAISTDFSEAEATTNNQEFIGKQNKVGWLAEDVLPLACHESILLSQVLA
jgi:hypothetical protein